jgi:hypothetical protein
VVLASILLNGKAQNDGIEEMSLAVQQRGYREIGALGLVIWF